LIIQFGKCIAIAPQIFQNKVFFSLPGEVFLIKEKKSFYEKFAGRQQYQTIFFFHFFRNGNFF
jgi:hypothetical protein